jgi:hypothetical protein
VITGIDIKKGRKFDDAIARACYGIDIHGQKDESSVMEHLKEGEYYEIPKRALFVKDAECINSRKMYFLNKRRAQRTAYYANIGSNR